MSPPQAQPHGVLTASPSYFHNRLAIIQDHVSAAEALTLPATLLSILGCLAPPRGGVPLRNRQSIDATIVSLHDALFG